MTSLVRFEKALIAIGANLGDPIEAVRAAFAELAVISGITDVIPAPLYDTAPMYVEDQPRFINSVALIKTSLEPIPLLDALQGIEKSIGRVKTYRNGPRAVDLDLVYYGGRIVSDKRLEVPHPRRLERRFVLAPAADVAPGFTDPLTKCSILDALHALEGRSDKGGSAVRIES